MFENAFREIGRHFLIGLLHKVLKVFYTKVTKIFQDKASKKSKASL